jgi:hypothetical protein
VISRIAFLRPSSKARQSSAGIRCGTDGSQCTDQIGSPASFAIGAKLIRTQWSRPTGNTRDRLEVRNHVVELVVVENMAFQGVEFIPASYPAWSVIG